MSIRILRRGAILLAGLGLAACQTTTDGIPLVGDEYDRGLIDRGHLSELQAGIWVDPDGCHVWIIDDGAACCGPVVHSAILRSWRTPSAACRR